MAFLLRWKFIFSNVDVEVTPLLKNVIPSTPWNYCLYTQRGYFFVLRAVIAMLWFSLQRLSFSSFCEYVEICGINCSWSDQSIFFNSVNC